MTSVLNKLMPNGQVRETLRDQLRSEMLTALNEAALTQPALANLLKISDGGMTFEGIAHLHSICVLKLR